QVVWVECQEANVAKHPWIHFGEATLVAVGMCRYRDNVQVDTVGFVEGGVLAGGTCQRGLIVIRQNRQDVQVGGRPRQSVPHRHHEPSAAMEVDLVRDH